MANHEPELRNGAIRQGFGEDGRVHRASEPVAIDVPGFVELIRDRAHDSARVMVGSVAEYVMRNASCPVMTVRV